MLGRGQAGPGERAELSGGKNAATRGFEDVRETCPCPPSPPDLCPGSSTSRGNNFPSESEGNVNSRQTPPPCFIV